MTDSLSYYRTASRFIDAELAERADLAFWEGIAAEYRPLGILELGCGTGRITERLAGAERRVVALDLSPEMLLRARRRLGSRSGVELVRGDMRALPFAASFDLIAAANDPFVHLHHARDRDRALAGIAAQLRPDGRFVVDALALELPMFEAAKEAEGYRAERVLRDGTRVREHWHCDLGTPLCHARYTWETAGEPAVHAEFAARPWTLEELERRCTRAGLRVCSTWGSYDRRAWAPPTASALLVVARRA